MDLSSCKLCKGEGRYRGMGGGLQVCFCPPGIEIRESMRRDCSAAAISSRQLQIALAVRRNIEMYAKKHDLSYPSMKGLCAFASMALAVAFDKERLRWQLCSGFFEDSQHTWLIHDENILDLTFTQFDRTAARVMVFNARDSRYRPLKTFDDMQVLLKQPHGGGPWRTIRKMAKV